MESETFQALCHAAGTVLGIDPPAVTYDEQGTALLSLRLNDVAITLAHQSDRCPEAALAFVDLGPPPRQLEHEAWLSLMDTNFLMGGDGTVSFACNPEGDEVAWIAFKDIAAANINRAHWLASFAVYALTES